MSKSRYFTIMVLSDELAEHRQFKLSFRAIKLAVGAIIALLLVTGISSYLWYSQWSSNAVLGEIKDENVALKLANDRYLNATIEIEEKLKYFDEKTSKLATLVGVSPEGIQVSGMGGAELLDSGLSQYLRHDLALIEDHFNIIEKRLETLDEAFVTQKEMLDTTPSLLPSKGWLVSGFQYRTDPFTKKKTWHNGLDISCPSGTPVYAPANGVIIVKGYNGGFGNFLEITHGNGIRTKYGHLSKFNVTKGERVNRGDLIAYVGSTGRSTGPHLHFEIAKDGKSVDPMKYIIDDIRPY